MQGISEFDKTNYIVVNGVKMTMAEYKKSKRPVKATKKRVRRTGETTIVGTDHKEVSLLAGEVEKLIKTAAPFKSLSVFYGHAYRSYGVVSEQIMKPYRKEYVTYQSKYREVERIIDIMHECGKNKENEIYDFAIQLAWKLDDMKIALNALIEKVRDNREVTARLFKGQPVYEGRMLGGKTPRELGFKHQLFSQSPVKIFKTMEKLEECVNTIKKWGETGRNPFDYRVY